MLPIAALDQLLDLASRLSIGEAHKPIPKTRMDVFPNVRVHLMTPSAYVLNIFRRQISQDKAICDIDAELVTAPTPAEMALFVSP